MLKVKKMKPTFVAFQCGTHSAEEMQRDAQWYANVGVEDNFDGTLILVSFWKKEKWETLTLAYGDWLVVRSDGKVKVMSDDKFWRKYQEEK